MAVRRDGETVGRIDAATDIGARQRAQEASRAPGDCIDITQRGSAEEMLRWRLRTGELVAGISTDFVNLSADQIEAGIERALAKIGRFTAADCCYIYMLHDGGGKMSKVYEWHEEGIDPHTGEMQNLEIQRLPWSIEQLVSSGLLNIPRVRSLEGREAEAREVLQRIGVQSLLCVPITIGGRLFGFLGLSAVRRERSWPDETGTLLRIVAEVLANGLLRRDAEKSLRELQDIVNRSPVLVFLWRIVPGVWPVEFVSGNVERTLGYTAEDFLSGRVSWPGITHPDDVPRLEAQVARYLEKGTPQWSQTYRLITRSGEVRWFTDQNLALSDAAAKVTRIQSIVLDVTEQKRMEDALCESERKYRELYEGSRDGTAAVDLAGRILHCNAVLLDMLGYRSEEIAGLSHRDITPARWLAEEARIVRDQVLTRGYSDVYEKEYTRKDGSVFPAEVRMYLTRDNAGSPLGMWSLVRDITERKKAEMQTQQHLAELTRAWHANTLGEMASSLAHELNQPLCAILNYSGGCLRLSRKEGFSLEALQNSIERIAAQAQRAADIVKRTRGLIARREPRRGGLDLSSVLTEAVGMLHGEAARHNVTIVCRFEPDLPRVIGDSVEIEQVALNLMRNAIEAMNEAASSRRIMTVSVSPAHGGWVEVAVADTGRGIPPGLAERVFESFFTTKHEGLGIGLSLSRRIVEAHGGRLWVESDGVSGATFRFTLPVEGAGHGEGMPCSVRGG